MSADHRHPAPSRDPSQRVISRRGLLRAGAAAGAALALPTGILDPGRAGAASRANSRVLARTYDFNRGWRVGRSRVTLPHTATPLSWGDWNPKSWERLWTYTKRFSAASLPKGRTFLDFDGVMTNATVYLNGVEMADHLGGFLPFEVELTDGLDAGHNDLKVVVDGRLLNVPPLGNGITPSAVDYLMPAGIHRDVSLRVVPETFIADVFAKPVNVLSSPGLDLAVTLDSKHRVHHRATLTAELLDGNRKIASTARHEQIRAGQTQVKLSLEHLKGIRLWSPASPKLYTVRVKLTTGTMPAHQVTVTTGFRQASFELDGFYLNGERLQIFGLNHHALFPYVGMAAPSRLQARDAQLLRQTLHCNMVRCSHYPQSPHFLDACDQLGLMVWEEPPGWQYIGDENYDAIFLQNVRDMVTRDRNRPSVVVWGTRLDETASYPTLYAEARQMAYDLDGSRQTTGAMDTQSTSGWAEDVFAYDDYNQVNGVATPKSPVPGVPYLISEAVGAITGPPTYRWVDSSATLQAQARLHAEVNQGAFGSPRYSGVLAWCGVDYASLQGGNRNWQTLKWCGVLDTFRVPKPGASFYRSQVSPQSGPVILPAFYWDFGPNSPSSGPGQNAILATNCDELHVYVGGELLTVATPDRADYGNLPYPPAQVNLTVDGSTLPELVVQGYVGGALVTTLQMSADTSTDSLGIDLEDSRITGDGTDATRLTFRALDRYGNQRPYVSGDVSLKLRGPATLVGQNPFAFQEYGGVGGVLIRSEAGKHGTVRITASHPTLGSRSASLKVVKATARYL